jgi:hypothetical protein
MKTRTMLASLAVFLGGVALGSAEDVNMGTWKLNEAKSKISPGGPRNSTVAYTAAGDKVKVTVDGVDAEGKPAHSEWTGQFDGKDYAVSGDPTSDLRAYKRIDDHTLEFTGKKAGKVTVSGKVVVAADGKSRTVTTTSTDAKGAKISSTALYDKQ